MKILRSKVFVTSLAFVLLFTNVLGNFNPTVHAEEISTLAAWSYSADTQLPAAATTGSGTLDLSGATLKAYSSSSLAANAWTLGAGWVMSVDASNYQGLLFSASMRSSSTGPGRFDLEYSLDGGGSWTVVENSQISIASTSLSSVYNAFALPTDLSGKQFLLRITACELITQKGIAVDTFNSAGSSNINHIVISGTLNSTPVEEPVKETCENVTVSLDSGEVASGTTVALNCATEGASIYYNTNDTSNYSLYTDPITITENMEIHTFASKEGYNDSEIKTFSYTVKAAEAEKTGNKLDSLINGDQVILYHSATGMVMSETESSSKLSGISASVVDNILDTPSGAAVLTVSVDTNGYYSFLCNGEYLTAGSTGGSLTLEAEASDYSLWNIEAVEAGFKIININAAYNTKSQYIEYYNSSFTTYSYSDTYSTQYIFEFYQATESDDPADPEEDTDIITATLTDAIHDGDVVALYYDKESMALSTTASGTKLAGIGVTPENDSFEVSDGIAQLTVSIDENGYYSFICDGRYLTSASTGNGLSFSDTANSYSLWQIETTENGNYLINVNAKYGTNNQYLEFYGGNFTTYSYKSSNDAIYLYHFYKIASGEQTDPGLVIDDSISFDIAQWAGNADYSGISDNQIFGDLYKTNDMQDSHATYSAVVSGNKITPFTSSTSNGSITYYMGGVGLGSGTDDYLQFVTSSLGYGDMNLSFRLRSSNTGAGSFQLQYSVDGSNFVNLSTGTYSYSYTAYNSSSESYIVSDSGTVTDGIAKTSYAPGNYVAFSFDIPNEAANADILYIRMVPGTEAAKTGSTLGTKGTLRADSVELKGSPIVSTGICEYVVAQPAAGEVELGQELTLTSDTSGATIYYSYDGVNFTEYDSENKSVIAELPANITVYAKKSGLQDSIHTIYQYTQAQCENVKATPNGGAVALNSKVRLKDETEGATILYAIVEEGQEDVLEWKTYDSNLVLKELPVTIKAKAIKDGCLDSAISTFIFTEKLNEKYSIFFGQIHAHTNYSDGAGTVEDAFSYATQVDDLDFLAITDHSNMLDNESQSILSENVDTSETDEWTQGHILADLYSTSDFTCLYGFEMTWSNGLGHINTFDTEGFQSRTQTDYSTYSSALQNYYSTLATVPDSISQFNHPGTTFGDFNDFAYYSEETDDLITLIEVGNGEGTIGSSGYFPSYEYYTRALDKGWHVAPTNNQDNHKGKWGDANTARTVVLADSNTEENIYDAMRNYRVYASEDNNLNIYYTLDDFIMGSILDLDQVGDTVTIEVEIQDEDVSDSIGTVEVIVNGGLSIASKTITSNEEDVVFEVPSSYSYYYIKITESDADIAVTAPVWVGEVESCGINSISTTTSVPVQGEALDVNLELYNNEEQELNIESIEFSIDGTSIKSVSGDELQTNNIASIPSAGNGTYSFDYVYDDAGYVTIDVLVNATLNGVEKIYKDSLSLSYVQPEMVTHVLIDGTHYNDYVTGYYGGNMTSFIDICSSNNIIATIETDEITAEELEDCELLLISAPAKKTGTANTGSYEPSYFSDEFISMVSEYVKNGGSVILCGIADYQDTTAVRTTEQMNKLLAAIGSNITINSDEVYDETNNGGQAYRLYFENFNMDSEFLTGVVDGQQYSMYSGCSVNLTEAVENDSVYSAIPLVYGFDTTYSVDSRDASGGYLSAPYDTVVNQGEVIALAQQQTKAGGTIFVAGSIFMSDFEIDAVMDNSTSLQYANYNIVCNILSTITKELPVSTIAEARKGELGDTFCVEGYVTSGTENPDTTFFDTIYIQDETGGIDIFPYAESGLAIGTKIRIVGYVSQYQGDIELKVISYEILSDESVVLEPIVLSTKNAMDYSTYGGSLIKTSGVVTRVTAALDESGVSEFWIKDSSGVEAAIFIDGYIYSGTTGKNELASLVKVGENITAIGILYMHPEDDADESVPVLRVRNCDEIVKKIVSSTNTSGNTSAQTTAAVEDTSEDAENTDTSNSPAAQATNDGTQNENGNEEEDTDADLTAAADDEITTILPEEVPASSGDQSTILPGEVPTSSGDQLSAETKGFKVVYILIILTSFGLLVALGMFIRRKNLLEKK